MDLSDILGGNTDKAPTEANAELRTAAKSMFELRAALVEAGFTKVEANKMVIQIVFNVNG